MGELDEYGQRYTVDFTVKTVAGSAIIRRAWIVLRGKKIPRLTTCFVKGGKR